MPTGDQICRWCGGYWCQSRICQAAGLAEEMMKKETQPKTCNERLVPRDVAQYEPEDLPFDYSDTPHGRLQEILDRIDMRATARVADQPTRNAISHEEIGRSLTDVQLLEIVTGYLGDPVFAARFVGCMSMIRRKNADYSQGEQKGDRIAAFRRIARDTNVTMEQAWAVFTQKHWGAVMKFVKDGILESESISGRIDDLINYFVLLGAIIDDRKTGGK